MKAKVPKVHKSHDVALLAGGSLHSLVVVYEASSLQHLRA